MVTHACRAPQPSCARMCVEHLTFSLSMAALSLTLWREPSHKTACIWTTSKSLVCYQMMHQLTTLLTGRTLGSSSSSSATALSWKSSMDVAHRVVSTTQMKGKARRALQGAIQHIIMLLWTQHSHTGCPTQLCPTSCCAKTSASVRASVSAGQINTKGSCSKG